MPSVSPDPSPTPSGVRPRPTLHFTPPTNWLNDPNGLIVIDGTYHLFFQHNPTAPTWGNIHWGHASSADLARWEHLPVAIPPDEYGLAFSGSVVVDAENTAGFGAGAMVAVYTQDLNHLERQSLAYSLDQGLTWNRYEHNPVLSAPDGEPDFRDPKVLRYRDGGQAWWVMVVTLGADIVVYRSDDLKQWEPASRLALKWPWPNSIAEVPDLVRVPIAGTDDWIWTLIVSVIPGTGARRARVRYLPVDFDGVTIRPREPGAFPPAAIDVGPALYAPMAWDCSPEAPVMIGWFDETGLDSGDPLWRGRMSVPRRLRYLCDGDSTVLSQEPIVGPLTPQPIRQGDRELSDPCFILSVSGEFGADDRVRLRLKGQNSSVGIDLNGSATQIAATGLIGDDPHQADPHQDDRHQDDRHQDDRRAGADDLIWDDGSVRAGSQLVPGDLLERRDLVVPRDLVVIVDAGSIEIFADAGRIAWSAICDLGLGTTEVSIDIDPSSGARFEPALTVSMPAR